jgi:hypothetical protein
MLKPERYGYKEASIRTSAFFFFIFSHTLDLSQIVHHGFRWLQPTINNPPESKETLAP